MSTVPLLAELTPNPDWASLPLFDRTGWRRMAFGDFAESIGVRAEPKDAQEEIYVGLEHLDPQCLHIRRWGKGSDVTGTKLRFRKGDIIFGRRRAYQRKLAVAEFDGICSAHAMVVRAKPELVLPEFLPFLMMSDRFMSRAVEISVGSLSPTINWTTLKLEEFDLPPLDQQRRIAEVLWAVDGMLGTQRSLKQCTQTARKAFLDTLIAEGRSAAILGDHESWPHWREMPLSEAVEFLDGQRKPIKEADRAKRRGDYPYYGASGVIDTIDDFIFDEPLVLLGEDGANIVDRSSPLAFRVSGKIWVNNHAHVLRVKAPHSLIYVEYFLESLDYKPFVTGTAQPKLNKGVCEGIPIPLPDHRYQKEIELRLLAFEDSLESQTLNATESRGVLFSLLNQFT